MGRGIALPNLRARHRRWRWGVNTWSKHARNCGWPAELHLTLRRMTVNFILKNKRDVLHDTKKKVWRENQTIGYFKLNDKTYKISSSAFFLGLMFSNHVIVIVYNHEGYSRLHSDGWVFNLAMFTLNIMCIIHFHVGLQKQEGNI
jgi:hypothetical protein